MSLQLRLRFPPDAASIFDRIRTGIGEVIRGKREAIDRLLVAVLSEGHVLGEDT